MIIVALGANLNGPDGQSPAETLDQALTLLIDKGCRLVAKSPWFETEPVPASDQPWFVNSVVVIETDHSAETLLNLCLEIENAFGRERNMRWEARVLDMDVVAYNDLISPPVPHWADEEAQENIQLVLPHPRMHLRSFVLVPLVAIMPHWRHPVLGKRADELLASIKEDGVVRPLG